mmetsp:Transcript_26269/g.85472  ORF Transcript_26269/g.85472 Transcript_26269/m.85472 type:complete len:286 (-) Transcript_26269:44-901(-)
MRWPPSEGGAALRRLARDSVRHSVNTAAVRVYVTCGCAAPALSRRCSEECREPHMVKVPCTLVSCLFVARRLYGYSLILFPSNPTAPLKRQRHPSQHSGDTDDTVLRHSPIQHGQHRRRDLQPDAVLRLARRSADVRRADEARAAEERVVGGQRLLVEDVGGVAGERAGVEGRGDGSLVRDAAARNVDQMAATSSAVRSNRRHALEHLTSDEQPRLRRERAVQRDMRARAEQLLRRRQQRHAKRRRRLGRRMRRVCKHAHAEGGRRRRDAARNPPKPEEAQVLAG